MSRWFRFYDAALDDPKVQRLAPDAFKGWVNLLCLASRTGGQLPSVSDIAFSLRLSDDQVYSLLTVLEAAGLIDRDGHDNLSPHNWHDRQYQSDSSAERMRRHRGKKRDGGGDGPSDDPDDGVRDVTVTLQNRTEADTDTETEPEKNREDDTAPLGAGRHPQAYAFEAGVVRLTEIALARWVKTYAAINVEAELLSMAEFLGRLENRKNWFHIASAALAKKDREARLAVERIRAEAVARPAQDQEAKKKRELFV